MVPTIPTIPIADPRTRGSIRRRAAVLASVLVAVAVAAVITYTFFAVRESLLLSGETRATGAAYQLAALVGAPLPSRLAEVQKLVDDARVRVAVTNPSPEAEAAAIAWLKPIAANAQQHQTIELWTINGTRVAGVQLPPQGGTVPFATTPPATIGLLPYIVVDGMVLSEVVVPVREGGAGSPTIGYLLSRRLATNSNTNDVLNRLLGGGGRVMVGNRSGTVWTDVSKQIAGPPIDVTTPGNHHYRDADGATRIAGVAHVTGTPFAIVVDFPESLMIAPAWALLRQLALVGLLFTAIGMAVVWRLSGRLTRPLDHLAEALHAVSGGDYSRRVSADTNTEVGRLGRAFNAMAQQIEAGLAEIESRAREVRDNDRRKAAMMNAAIDCIITANADGRITECNPAAARLFGYDHEELLQQNLGALLLLPEYGKSHSLDAYLTTAHSQMLGKRMELQAHRRGSGLFPADVSLVAIRIDNAPGYAAFVRDLTEQKAGEESMLRGVLLEEENRRVLEASRLKSEFLANMSHELRTPLNAIIGFAELLYDGQVTPDMPQFKEFMHDILTSGQHLLQLINDVLDLSKVEAGRLDFHPEDTAVERIVGDAIGIMRALAAQKHLVIDQEIDPAIGTVFVDRARLKQVLYNYLSNAIKFTPVGGRVVVSASAESGDRFRIAVRDTGIGISAADLQRLFVEFNQLEAGAAKKHQGTGLGLALTKRLIEAQGGRVGVESIPGEGSTFFAELPRQATRGTPLAGPRSIVSPRFGAPSVLVIEDDPADQDVIVRALVEAGYSVETATTRAQAAVKLESQSFDAITLDLILPDANGADVLRDIKSSARNRHVPVVIITVVTNSGTIAGFAVNDILSKPVDGAGLIGALERAGVSPNNTGTVLVVDDDPGSLRLMAASLGQLGYTSVCVSSAIEGLRLCERQAPLAVVLDLQMPEMDGFGFLEHFRGLPACRLTPVIVWTVKDLTHDDYARLQASVQGIVGKGQIGGASVIDELRRFTTERQATP
jgi:PAS domain S-box-containing protein